MRIDLTAYATDCIVNGSLELRHDRLSDLLADELFIQVSDATVHALEDGRLIRLAALELQRVEIALVAATGPRGNAGRRLATVRRPAIATVGPYEVVGRLHGPPSTDPFELVRRREWIAITDAVVRYRMRARPVEMSHVGVIVNTGQLAYIDEIAEDELEARLAALLPPAEEPPTPLTPRRGLVV